MVRDTKIERSKDLVVNIRNAPVKPARAGYEIHYFYFTHGVVIQLYSPSTTPPLTHCARRNRRFAAQYSRKTSATIEFLFIIVQVIPIHHLTGA